MGLCLKTFYMRGCPHACNSAILSLQFLWKPWESVVLPLGSSRAISVCLYHTSIHVNFKQSCFWFPLPTPSTTMKMRGSGIGISPVFFWWKQESSGAKIYFLYSSCVRSEFSSTDLLSLDPADFSDMLEEVLKKSLNVTREAILIFFRYLSRSKKQKWFYLLLKAQGPETSWMRDDQ